MMIQQWWDIGQESQQDQFYHYAITSSVEHTNLMRANTIWHHQYGMCKLWAVRWQFYKVQLGNAHSYEV